MKISLEFMKKIEKVVIFGGSGFIGSDLCIKLSEIASEIMVLSRNPDSNKDLKVIPNLKLKLFQYFLVKIYKKQKNF